MPDTEPQPPAEKHHHHLEADAEKAVEDVAEFFEAGGDEDSPTSDSDSPAP
jgi:hypothetical protein